MTRNGPKKGPKWPKIDTQKGPKMTQNVPKWIKIALNLAFQYQIISYKLPPKRSQK